MDRIPAAFLLVQHADLSLQKEALPLVEQAFKSGWLSAHSYSLLVDRVRVREGKPQLYGNQVRIDGQQLVVEPIEDEDNVDKRRAELGLMPLSEYLNRISNIEYRIGILFFGVSVEGGPGNSQERS